MNPKFCFVAGTMVLTSLGLKAIEDIQVGVQVLSYNEELGIFTNKDVVEKYVNETKELVHIHTAKEEIVCTPKHSILTDKGWKEARDITEADSIQSTADLVQVQSVETEQLPEPIKVYNLNVIGYHTYIVGDNRLIVHNACANTDVEMRQANKSDFTNDAWKRAQSLTHKTDGSTISSLTDGRLIHSGFKADAKGLGKELFKKGVGRFDYIDKTSKIIYELKPNNSVSIAKGINQLRRYNIGMGGGYKLVLILY